MNPVLYNQVISLGPNCTAAYQAKRFFGKACCPSGIFDSQITPRTALLEYLSNDFNGMFERDDLELHKTYVINKRVGTQHPHEFKGFPIDARYKLARDRHDYLCRKVRSAIESDVPTLFVIRSFDPVDDLYDAIRAKNLDLRFHILAVPTPVTATWQGDDKEWNAFFEPYRMQVQPRLRQLMRAAVSSNRMRHFYLRHINIR